MSWQTVLGLILVVFMMAGSLLGAFRVVMNCLHLQKEVLTSQRNELSRLMNLVASKDLQTYTALQTLTMPSSQTPSNFDPSFVALDDESVAKRMAEQYDSNGVNAEQAYNSEDFTNEFGAGGVFIP